MRSSTKTNPEKIVIFLAFGILLYYSVLNFQQIAQGTGEWHDGYSPTWYVLYLLFAILCLSLLSFQALFIWSPDSIKFIVRPFINIREENNKFRWVVGAFALFLFPAIMQCTIWGVVFHQYPLRLLIWMLSLFLFSVAITRSRPDLIHWDTFLVSALVSGAFITILAQFTDVSMYPFSMGWSEGNRLWDYSIIFGGDRYLYPADQALSPYLDIGRQITGGVIFLFPNINIAAARFWVDLLNVLPYILIGFFAFKPSNTSVDEKNNEKLTWFLLVLWTFLFIRQGPVHAPLAVSAILVVIAWRRRLIISMPFIVLAAYFAAISRFTWTFSVAIWIVMLEFSYPKEVGKETWIRSIWLGIAGLFGGVMLPKIVGMLFGIEQGISSQTISNSTSQPLLWYRLLPSATYREGVLFGLAIATLPLLSFLMILMIKRIWQVNSGLQKLSLFLPLIAFLVVGLIVSTKVGGGGDLHNLDMFIIGLLFITAVAWLGGINNWLSNINESPFFVRCVLLVMVVLPILNPLMWLRPITYTGDLEWILKLTDITNPRGLNFLPSDSDVQNTLGVIRENVTKAENSGEILFMDQRQLLTFGYISTSLVPDYEKKVLMDYALSRKDDYFASFYKDLAAHRFSLIVSDPLKIPAQNSNDEFGEENNLWVVYVSRPILCYYEPMETYPELRVQLLIPRTDSPDCSTELPFEMPK